MQTMHTGQSIANEAEELRYVGYRVNISPAFEWRIQAIYWNRIFSRPFPASIFLRDTEA